MKNLIRVAALGLLAMLIFNITIVSAAQDELECVLPNGDKFVLINKYDYSPLAKFVPHAATRGNDYGFDVYFKPSGELRVNQAMYNFGRFSVSSEIARKRVCAKFTLVDQLYGTITGLKIQENHLLIPMVAGWSAPLNLLNAQEDIAKGLGYLMPPPGALIRKVSAEIVIEYALYSSADAQKFSTAQVISISPVLAVIQTISHDSGKTWVKPAIVKKAKLFVIGKSMSEQPYVAKPGEWKSGEWLK